MPRHGNSGPLCRVPARLLAEDRVMAYVIEASQLAPFPGWYLKSVGSVDAYWTPRPGEARLFASFDEAMTFWNSMPPGLGAFFPVSVREVPG